MITINTKFGPITKKPSAKVTIVLAMGDTVAPSAKGDTVTAEHFARTYATRGANPLRPFLRVGTAGYVEITGVVAPVADDWRPVHGAAIIDIRGAARGETILVISEHASITEAADAMRPGDTRQIVTARGDYFVVTHAPTSRGVFDRDADCHIPAPRGRLLFFIGGSMRERHGHLSAGDEAAYAS